MRRTSIAPQQKVALLGMQAPVTADAPTGDPLQTFMEKYDLNNPKKRLLVAGGLVGAFMLVLRAKSLFT